MKLAIAIFMTLAAGMPIARSGAVQIPGEFKNLQVLLKDISKAALVQTMRDVATDLGVRCPHCQVGPDNLPGMDFASDQKRTKQVARTMLAMTRAAGTSAPLG